MKFIRYIILLCIAFMALSWFTQSGAWKKYKAAHPAAASRTALPATTNTDKLLLKAAAAKKFTAAKGYNTNTCFLIDMSLPSGQSRFYIYNMVKDSVEASGLVAHGNCFEYWLEGRRYSNVVGSGCTSLGRYKIGASYTGKWGYSYKLHGLDSTNNNAFERTVVLHSHSCVAESETSEEICQSNGCPTVSPGFLDKLKPIINRSAKPVLLWIFE